MFYLLRITGWCLAALFYAVLGGMALAIAPVMITPGGWIMAPAIIILARRIARRVRRRRGLAVLEHVHRAVGLNLPLPTLLAVAANGEGGKLGDRLDSVAQAMARGRSVGEAIDESVDEVTPRDRSLILAGERVSRLPQTLDRLLRNRRAAMRRDGALSTVHLGYPIAVATVSAIVITLFVILIVPKFERLFDDFEAPMPAMTASLFAFGRWLVGRHSPAQLVPGILWLVLASVATFIVITLRSAGLWREIFDPPLWYLPVFHGIERDRGLGDAFSLLGEATAAGVPLPRSLREAAELRVNIVLQRRLRRWSRDVADGVPLAEAARRAGLPPMAVGLLASGGEAAEAAQAFEFLGHFYDHRFSRAAAVLQGMIVPVAILGLAALVGWIVCAMFVPLVVLIRSVTPPGAL